MAAVTFKEPLIRKMKTVEKCSPDFFPQMHTCCQWQMLCCGAIRWIILSSVDARNAAVLSFPVLAVLVNCLSPPLLFSWKAQVFHKDSEYRRRGLRVIRGRTEVPRFVFHTAHMGGSALLANVSVKKFPGAKVQHASVSWYPPDSLPPFLLLDLYFPALPWVSL